PVLITPKPEDLPCKGFAPSMEDSRRKNWESGGGSLFWCAFWEKISKGFSFALKQRSPAYFKFVNQSCPALVLHPYQDAERMVFTMKKSEKRLFALSLAAAMLFVMPSSTSAMHIMEGYLPM